MLPQLAPHARMLIWFRATAQISTSIVRLEDQIEGEIAGLGGQKVPARPPHPGQVPPAALLFPSAPGVAWIPGYRWILSPTLYHRILDTMDTTVSRIHLSAHTDTSAVSAIPEPVSGYLPATGTNDRKALLDCITSHQDACPGTSRS